MNRKIAFLVAVLVALSVVGPVVGDPGPSTANPTGLLVEVDGAVEYESTLSYNATMVYDDGTVENVTDNVSVSASPPSAVDINESNNSIEILKGDVDVELTFSKDEFTDTYTINRIARENSTDEDVVSVDGSEYADEGNIPVTLDNESYSNYTGSGRFNVSFRGTFDDSLGGQKNQHVLQLGDARVVFENDETRVLDTSGGAANLGESTISPTNDTIYTITADSAADSIVVYENGSQVLSTSSPWSGEKNFTLRAKFGQSAHWESVDHQPYVVFTGSTKYVNQSNTETFDGSSLYESQYVEQQNGELVPTDVVLDDFSDGDISEYSGSTSQYGVSGGVLERTGTSSSRTSIYRNGVTVQQGDTIEVDMWKISSTNSEFLFGTDGSGNHYAVRFYKNTAYLSEYSGGSEVSQFDSNGVGLNDGNRYTLNISWQDTGDIDVDIYNSNGVFIGSLSGVDSTISSGGIGWATQGTGGPQGAGRTGELGDDVSKSGQSYAIVRDGSSTPIDRYNVAIQSTSVDSVVTTGSTTGWDPVQNDTWVSTSAENKDLFVKMYLNDSSSSVDRLDTEYRQFLRSENMIIKSQTGSGGRIAVYGGVLEDGESVVVMVNGTELSNLNITDNLNFQEAGYRFDWELNGYDAQPGNRTFTESRTLNVPLPDPVNATLDIQSERLYWNTSSGYSFRVTFVDGSVETYDPDSVSVEKSSVLSAWAANRTVRAKSESGETNVTGSITLSGETVEGTDSVVVAEDRLEDCVLVGWGMCFSVAMSDLTVLWLLVSVLLGALSCLVVGNGLGTLVVHVSVVMGAVVSLVYSMSIIPLWLFLLDIMFVGILIEYDIGSFD